MTTSTDSNPTVSDVAAQLKELLAHPPTLAHPSYVREQLRALTLLLRCTTSSATRRQSPAPEPEPPQPEADPGGEEFDIFNARIASPEEWNLHMELGRAQAKAWCDGHPGQTPPMFRHPPFAQDLSECACQTLARDYRAADAAPGIPVGTPESIAAAARLRSTPPAPPSPPRHAPLPHWVVEQVRDAWRCYSPQDDLPPSIAEFLDPSCPRPPAPTQEDAERMRAAWADAYIYEHLPGPLARFLDGHMP